VATDAIVVLDDGREAAFSFADMLSYHGGGSPGGVAHAFKVLERGLPLLNPAGLVERREIYIETAFGGPGARDGFELVTRARPGLGRAREQFVFRLHYGDQATILTLRRGFVTNEFIDLTRQDGRTADQEHRLARMKNEMAARVMSAVGADVYDVDSAQALDGALRDRLHQ
jgi:hypothetical protein